MIKDYTQIEDYGIIGNMRSAALISRYGSIDWCCFPEMSSGSVFASILDIEKGGSFSVSPLKAGKGNQYYFGDTNILVTEFQQGRGKVTITDFMPISGSIHGCGGSEASPEIHRIIECFSPEAEIEIEWSPRFDYARSGIEINKVDGGWLAKGGGETMVLCGLEEGKLKEDGYVQSLSAVITMKQGEKRVLVTSWDSEDTHCSVEETLHLMDQTARIWEEWASREKIARSSDWAGEHHSLLVRSALVLKLLSHADTGAIAAAPTTSLPETLGGVRNWDYRFSWIRDASMTARALMALGHEKEAADLLTWMERVSAAHEDDWELQIMYGLHGEPELEEQELSHLEGYKNSQPVRIGNEAAEQFQLEVYGELLSMGYELLREGHSLEPKILSFLRKVADHVCEVWNKPDYGIWEVRGEPLHLTYSKVMAWLAVDSALKMAEENGLEGDVEKWKKVAEDIRAEVLEHGFNREMDSFVQAFDSDELDAANLRIPLLGFLPPDDPRVQKTILATMEELMENGLVYRYLYDDGLPGKEGAFGLCTFWLVDALALSSKVDEAKTLFERMIKRANHLGLFSEQIDPETGAFLGNFPQAFTHIGLINSAIILAYAEKGAAEEYLPYGILAKS